MKTIFISIILFATISSAATPRTNSANYLWFKIEYKNGCIYVTPKKDGGNPVYNSWFN